MNVHPTRVIVTEQACNTCGVDRFHVHHETFSEMRVGGQTAKAAADRLARSLESALDIVVDPLHREPLRQAIADVRAFVNSKGGPAPSAGSVECAH